MPLYTRATAHLATQAGGFEPQRQHNWSFEVSGIGGDADSQVLALSLVQGFLPTGYNEEVPIPYGNEVVYVAGRAIWEPGGLICRDFIDQNVAAQLLEWRRQVYDPATGAIGLAASYKKEASIVLFPPNYDEAAGATNTEFQRQWKLHGCWPIRVNAAANGLDMTSSGQVMIELSIRYDRAEALL